MHVYAKVLQYAHLPPKIFAVAAVFKATGDALARPLPHVYQTDAQGTTTPIVPLEQSRQEAQATMGTAGQYSAVRVQDLSSISQKHVGPAIHSCRACAASVYCMLCWRFAAEAQAILASALGRVLLCTLLVC